MFNWVLNTPLTLREKCLYSEWVVFFSILRISPYSMQMRENTDQKNSEYGHFSHSVTVAEKVVLILFNQNWYLWKQCSRFLLLRGLNSMKPETLLVMMALPA